MPKIATLWTALALVAYAAVTVSAVPAAPTALTAAVNGSTVTLSWTGPPGAVLQYRLEAGSLPGAANLVSGNVGVAASYVATAVPPGNYYVRVRAVGVDGQGPPSNEVLVNVGGCAAPPPPPHLSTPSVVGNSVNLAWSAGAGGCSASSYVLLAGSISGVANIGAVNRGLALSYATSAPGGVYYVRVLAQNAHGSSLSNEVVVTVGSPGVLSVLGSGDATFVIPASVRRVRVYASATANNKGFSVSINGQLVISERLSIDEPRFNVYDVIHDLPPGDTRVTVVTSLNPAGLTWSFTQVP